MATPQTAQAEIRPRSQHKPPFFSAGVRLFHNQNIMYLNIHDYTPLMASQYCLAACSSLLGPYS